jgi:PhnB protein
MVNVTLNPYLFFDGNCREAMEFYKGVFGGTLNVMTYDEAPGQQAGAMKGKVMHASLTEGDADLMASDSPQPDRSGTGKISLSLSGTDEQRLRSIFDRLAVGGKVTSALKKEFWGDTYGSLTDRFGVEWMMNITAPKA